MDPAWKTAVEVLTELLQKAGDGAVSTQALRRRLEARGLAEARELVARLKSVDFDSTEAPAASMRWYHFGRSFLTEQKYREAQKSQEVEADKAEALESAAEEALDDTEHGLEEMPPPERKKGRAEERRIGTYIVPILEELYDADFSPENYVFDVHSER